MCICEIGVHHKEQQAKCEVLDVLQMNVKISEGRKGGGERREPGIIHLSISEREKQQHLCLRRVREAAEFS